MDPFALFLALPDFEQGSPIPTEFKLLSVGRTDTSKGPIMFSKRSEQAVLADEKAKGRTQIPFDYGHGQLGLVQTAESSAAAAWATLSFRNGEPWMTDIQWTPRATKGLADREWRFFSPAVMLDSKTREVLAITNVALTNLPATKGQEPLVASDTAAPTAAEKDPLVDKDTLMRLFVALGVTDETKLAPAVTALLADRQTLIEAAAASQAKLVIAEAKLAEHATVSLDTERTALITALSAAKILEPALHEWAKVQSLDTLKTYAAAAKPKAAIAGTVTPKDGGTPRALTAVEEKLCADMGTDPAEFLQMDAEIKRQGNPWCYEPGLDRAPAKKEGATA